MTDESRIRNLSKTTWIMYLALLTFEVGAAAWLVAGRPTTQPRDLPYKGNTGRPVPRYPEYDRPGRFAATNPDDDERFSLRQVRERAEQQTRAAREQRAERERQAEAQRQAEEQAGPPKTGHPSRGA